MIKYALIIGITLGVFILPTFDLNKSTVYVLSLLGLLGIGVLIFI